jgi:hypothetical protein
MKTLGTRFSTLTSGLAGAIIMLAAGCSSDNNKNPTPGVTGGAASTGGSASGDTGGSTSGDTGGNTSSETGGSTNEAASSSAGGSSGVGGSSSAGGSTSAGSTSVGGGTAGGASGTGGGGCVPDTSKSCYSCPPTTNDQILKACSNATCQPFDNTAKNVPSTLPQIP